MSDCKFQVGNIVKFSTLKRAPLKEGSPSSFDVSGKNARITMKEPNTTNGKGACESGNQNKYTLNVEGTTIENVLESVIEKVGQDSLPPPPPRPQKQQQSQSNSLLNTLTFGYAGNQTPEAAKPEPTNPFSLNIEVKVQPDDPNTQTPGKAYLGSITVGTTEIDSTTDKPINSDTKPTDLSSVIAAKIGTNTDYKEAFDKVYIVKRGIGQKIASTVSFGNYSLSQNKLKEDALAALTESIKKIEDEEAKSDLPKGKFKPSYLKILKDLKTYIYNEGKEDGQDVVFEDKNPELKLNYGYNFKYADDIKKNTESILYKMVFNLKRMLFINRNPVANWMRPITDTKDAGNGYTVYFFPGWEEDKAKPTTTSVFGTRPMFFDTEKLFLDKIMNFRAPLQPSKILAKGGRRTRKHKKSKTQKAGRKNKKTRKH